MVFLNKNSEKKIYQILINIVGLNKYNSDIICKKFGFQKNCTLKNLDSLDLEQLKNYLSSNFILNKILIENTNNNVKRKIDLGIYQGKRHNLGYPVRGQRTLSNGKTQKKLHKFRFYYNSKLFTHTFFKNQRKSNKKKKIFKFKKVKGSNTKLSNISSSLNNRILNESFRKDNLKKKQDDNVSYLEKLNKIKEERQKQIDSKFIKARKEAKINHPYFKNIQKANVKKKNKKK